jgi:hypothetical protein
VAVLRGLGFDIRQSTISKWEAMKLRVGALHDSSARDVFGEACQDGVSARVPNNPSAAKRSRNNSIFQFRVSPGLREVISSGTRFIVIR